MAGGIDILGLTDTDEALSAAGLSGIDIFLSEADVYITLPHGGTGTDDIFSELLLRVIHVPVVQLDAASFFQTVV